MTIEELKSEIAEAEKRIKERLNDIEARSGVKLEISYDHFIHFTGYQNTPGAVITCSIPSSIGR